MILKPTCQVCKKNNATIKITRIVEGKAQELNLCKTCAAEISPYQKKMAQAQENIGEILAKLLGTSGEGAAKTSSGKQLQCSSCGLRFDTYRKTLFLGCSECYESFESELMVDLRRFHGSTSHKGKIPTVMRQQVLTQKRLEELRQELSQAIEREEFEHAARLRDQIRELETLAES